MIHEIGDSDHMPKGELESPHIRNRSITVMYGRVLREAREKAGIHQREAASEIEISQATLSRFEAGTAQPDWPTFVQMGRVYGCKPTDLMPANSYPSAPLDPKARREFMVRRNAYIQGNDPDEAVRRILGEERHDAIGKGS